ncbi:hypothetical protein J2S97_000727 [Arthrobacter oryzae]|jgi:hypothetical protein|nr:hypothetical protein [Arthrobacter oryzae]
MPIFRLVERGYSVVYTKRCAAGGRFSVRKRGTNFMVFWIAW